MALGFATTLRTARASQIVTRVSSRRRSDGRNVSQLQRPPLLRRLPASRCRMRSQTTGARRASG